MGFLTSEGAAPSTPATGKVAIYAKTDGLLYSKNDAGTETSLSGTTLRTEQAASGLSTVSFPSIPSNAVQVTIGFSGISLSGTDNILIRFGTGGSAATTGYLSGNINGSSTVAVTSATNGFLISSGNASSVIQGSYSFILTSPSSNIWSGSGVFYRSDADQLKLNAGQVALSGALDIISVVTSGVNTFDGGIINIAYS